MVAKDTVPALMISTDSSIEVTKEQKLVGSRNFLDNFIQLILKHLFIVITTAQSGGIGTYESKSTTV